MPGSQRLSDSKHQEVDCYPCQKRSYFLHLDTCSKHELQRQQFHIREIWAGISRQ